MTTEIVDPFELLRQGDPAPLATTPAADSALGREIYARVMATTTEPARRRTRPPARRIVGIALAVLAALALAAAVWSIRKTVTQTSDMVCYQGLTLDSSRSGGLAPDVFEPEACESLWLNGTLVNVAIAAPGTVPPLVGCVSDRGVLFVLPSDDAALCGSLGLAEFERSPGILPGTILDRRLRSIFGDGSCRSMQDAQVMVTGLFEEQGLSGWTVRVIAEPTPQRPCASYGLDSVNRVVFLTPIPDLGPAD
jgi:hypothetical protein